MAPNKNKILVVDDTEATRYAITRTLISGGYQVIEAKTGQEALDLVRSEKPDLLTLDIHLPDILGFEVCRRIKLNPETAHIMVLQVSASFVTSKDRIHGLEGGADSYLTHPFEPPVLLATVKALLRNSQLVADLQASQRSQRLAVEEAELANEAKSRFLSNMSHEIRTPLGIIQGFTDLALESVTTEPERLDYLQKIRRNAEGLTKLVGQILDLAKIEAGRVDLERAPFDLRDLVWEVVDSFGILASEKGIALRVHVEESLSRQFVSDALRIRQVLLNLLSNAFKFTTQGHIAVDVMAGPSADFIRFLISDTGIGVSEKQRERLFQPFSQADSSVTRKYGGTGLGLSLSRKLAQSLGGELRLIESQPGRGSQFEFLLNAPVVHAPSQDENVAVPPALGQAAKTVGLKNLKVLLVDDSLDNQSLFAQYLTRAGIKVDLANDGAEALERAAEAQYDVILMDIQMPRMDGLEATRRLRESGVTSPIFALTANAMMEERQRALASGFSAYLIKPINASTLLRALAPYA